MVKLPWRDDEDDEDGERGGSGEATDGPSHEGAVVVCTFQDGTLVVYEDEVVIERVSRSRFEDKTIPLSSVEGVDYESGITVGYLQIEEVGVPVDAGGLLSDPVNENTVHFGRGGRECATEARDAILERARG